MARCEQKVWRSTWDPMIRSPARLQPNRSAASMADCVNGLPSAWQNTSSDFRCRCALSAALSRVVSGTLRSRPLFGVPTTPFQEERRIVNAPVTQSTSPHSRAISSPCRSPASAPNRTSARRSGSLFTASMSRDSSSNVRKSNFCCGIFKSFTRGTTSMMFNFVRVAQHFAEAGQYVVHPLPTEPLGEQTRLEYLDRMHLDVVELHVRECRKQVVLQNAGFHRTL